MYIYYLLCINCALIVYILQELSMEKKTAETNLTHLSDILETAKSLESQLLAPPVSSTYIQYCLLYDKCTKFIYLFYFIDNKRNEKT